MNKLCINIGKMGFLLMLTLGIFSIGNTKEVKAALSYEEELQDQISSLNDYVKKDNCMFEVSPYLNEAWVIGFDKDATDIKIPESVLGKPVTHISLYQVVEEADVKVRNIQISSKIEGVYGLNFLKQLEMIFVDPDNDTLIAKNGVLYGCDNRTEEGYVNQIVCMPPNSSYKKYQILEGTQMISYNAFMNCRNIEEVTLNDTIRSIGEYAFKNSSLEKIVLSAKLSYIDCGAFAYCTLLKDVVVPEQNTCFQYKDGVLYGFINGEERPSMICMTGEYSKSGFTVPKGVEAIERYAFTNNRKLKKVTVTNSVHAYGDAAFASDSIIEVSFNSKAGRCDANAFEGANALKRIVVHKNHKNMKSVNGVLFSKDGKWLLYVPSRLSCKKYTIPAKVEYIDTYALQGQKTIKEIHMANTVKEISGFAFYQAKVEKVVVSKNLSQIGPSAFKQAKVKQVDLTSKVKVIPYGCFEDCSKLKKVILPSKTKKIMERAFVNCIGLKKIAIPASVKKIGSNLASEYWGSKPKEVNAFYRISLDKSRFLDTVRKITIVAKKNSYAYRYAKKHKKYGFVAKKA